MVRPTLSLLPPQGFPGNGFPEVSYSLLSLLRFLSGAHLPVKPTALVFPVFYFFTPQTPKSPNVAHRGRASPYKSSGYLASAPTCSPPHCPHGRFWTQGKPPHTRPSAPVSKAQVELWTRPHTLDPPHPSHPPRPPPRFVESFYRVPWRDLFSLPPGPLCVLIVISSPRKACLFSPCGPFCCRLPLD